MERLEENEKFECRIGLFSLSSGICHYCGEKISEHKVLYRYGFDPY